MWCISVPWLEIESDCGGFLTSSNAPCAEYHRKAQQLRCRSLVDGEEVKMGVSVLVVPTFLVLRSLPSCLQKRRFRQEYPTCVGDM